MSLFIPLLCLALTAFTAEASSSLASCPDTSHAKYDYIVVGAGNGGGPVAARLAEAGFSVLVVDAGHDVVNDNTTLPYLNGAATTDPQLELAYTIDEYPANFQYQKDGVWYPRARGIGGCTIHNALNNVLASTKADYDNLAAITNDPTWSYNSVWEYFKRIENNLYIPAPNVDHGYTGWLKTQDNPYTLDSSPLSDIWAALFASAPVIDDLNSRAADSEEGATGGSFTEDEVYHRNSIRDHIVQVQQSLPNKLKFALDTLATKVHLCKDRAGKTRAYGVEIAPGAALAVASNFQGKQTLHTRTVTAKREIIVAAGVFQSPQLLMLSGIGEKNQLQQFGIKTIVNLPGVGKNLQDHDEIATIWSLKDGTTLFKRDAEPRSTDGTLPGSPNLIRKSSPSLPETDIYNYWVPFPFPGYGYTGPAFPFNALTSINLKAHASSSGVVRLTGSHPQDVLSINKQRFQAAGGPQDVAILREQIKKSRLLVANTPEIAQYIDVEIFPGPQAQTDAEIEAHIYDNVFSHHGCCTNKIGANNDPNAVLDRNFKVRGVSNLRVVDMSSWPHNPGFFPMTPTYMIAEKAADVIIAAAAL